MDSFVVPWSLDANKQNCAVLVKSAFTQISCWLKALFGLHASQNALRSAMFKLVAKRPMRACRKCGLFYVQFSLPYGRREWRELRHKWETDLIKVGRNQVDFCAASMALLIMVGRRCCPPPPPPPHTHTPTHTHPTPHTPPPPPPSPTPPPPHHHHHHHHPPPPHHPHHTTTTTTPPSPPPPTTTTTHQHHHHPTITTPPPTTTTHQPHHHHPLTPNRYFVCTSFRLTFHLIYICIIWGNYNWWAIHTFPNCQYYLLQMCDIVLTRSFRQEAKQSHNMSRDVGANKRPKWWAMHLTDTVSQKPASRFTPISPWYVL